MHTLKIRKIYFDMIKDGIKTIELRLNDEKRQAIKIGDVIEISENDNPDNKFMVRVTNLYYAKTFAELCAVHDCRKMGFDSLEQLLSVVSQFYDAEKHEKYGIVGIEIELI